MTSEKRIVSLLFADIAGFSKSGNDQLLAEVQQHLKSFCGTQISPEKCLYMNTWGDALLLVCGDPNDALEYALQLRDWFKNRNWGRIGLSDPVHIRIGLHAERVTIISEDKEIADVSGRHVSLAARVEPIVPEDSIYCTEPFYVLAKDESHTFVRFVDLGERELAKSFGSMRLYEVARGPEQTVEKAMLKDIPFGVSIPKIRKEFSDSEKDSFLEKGFEFIRSYMHKAAKVLEETDSDIKAQVSTAPNGRTICEVFVKGKRKASCQVWMSNEYFSKGIQYSQNINSSDNSYNESLHVSTDGFTLFLEATGMLSFSHNIEKRMDYQNAANLYWEGLTKQLEH